MPLASAHDAALEVSYRRGRTVVCQRTKTRHHWVMPQSADEGRLGPSYTLHDAIEPAPTAPRVTESFHDEGSLGKAMTWLTMKWTGSSDLRLGMTEPLTRIKAAAEAACPPRASRRDAAQAASGPSAFSFGLPGQVEGRADVAKAAGHQQAAALADCSDATLAHGRTRPSALTARRPDHHPRRFRL